MRTEFAAKPQRRQINIAVVSSLKAQFILPCLQRKGCALPIHAGVGERNISARPIGNDRLSIDGYLDLPLGAVADDPADVLYRILHDKYRRVVCREPDSAKTRPIE